MKLDDDHPIADNKKRALDVILEASKKRRRTGYTIQAETEQECDTEMDVDETPHSLIQISSMCPVAKPAPFRPAINFGPISYVPNLGGHLFPYFHGCLDNDNSYVIDVFRRFFLFSFGADPDDCGTSYNTWRANVSQMMFTDSGSIVQHMTLGMELAIDTQSRLYYLVEGSDYHGFVLLGYRFAVNAYSKIQHALSAEKLKSELDALTTHESSLKDLCKLLSDLVIDGDTMKETLTIDSVESARDLYDQIARRSSEMSVAKKTKFESHLRGLSFRQSYLRPSRDNIIEMLRALSDPELPLSQWPLFLHPEFVFSNDRSYEVLSAFGPTAPSFINITGNRYQIPYEDVEDHGTSTTPDKEDPVSSILVSMKALNVAVGDTRKMMKEVAIYQNFQERAKANRNIMFNKGYGRDEVWKALRKYVAGSKPDGQPGEESGPSKPPKMKKRKIADREADFDEF
jgi:hypothetical protein